MSTQLREIPEVSALDAPSGVVRIPPGVDVPLTPRVRRLVDSRPFRRLSRVRQLGLVSLVYPGATHSRFEHSLGVYRNALHYLRQLSFDERFRSHLSREAAEKFIVAALLHDLGHWPFCHPIEDMRLEDVPRHEVFVERFITSEDLAQLLRDDWQLEPQSVCELLSGKAVDDEERILCSMLSGPIDIDKLDYLPRDSLHAGVPYGRHFDEERLVRSLCLNDDGTGLALTEKGRTAAELLVFARYVMFSEVYWHHGVRAATSMLQRAFFALRHHFELPELFSGGDDDVVEQMLAAAQSEPTAPLVNGLFGSRRVLYKRLAEYSFFQAEEIYSQLARRPYGSLVQCGAAFAELASRAVGGEVAPHEVLFDAPPVEKEVEFNVQVRFREEKAYRNLEEVSPVVRALAKEQFDDIVKRVRVFVHPRWVKPLRELGDLREIVLEAAART